MADDSSYNNKPIEVIPPGGDISSPPTPPWDGKRYNQPPFLGVEQGITPGRPLERSPVDPLKPA